MPDATDTAPADTAADAPVSPLANLPIGQFLPVVPGVHRLAILFVNVYVVESAGGFVLIDTGPPAAGWYIQKAITALYGMDAKPRAIILTHAHFDHAGNAMALADAYDVPVYVHEQELPYVTGRSDYPPQDPTPGGAICFLSRFFPRGAIDLADRVTVLPADMTVPHLPEWTWVHTPGHTAGHVSLSRASDGTVIAGDAVATHDMDAWGTQMTWTPQLSRPATPFTPDWVAARRSIHAIADLNPVTIAAGHGLPIRDPEMEKALRTFADAMAEPDGGRYADTPVTYDDSGAVSVVPPPVADPIGRTLTLAAAGVAAGALGAAAILTARQRKRVQ